MKPFTTLAVIIFAIMALVHLLRMILDFQIIIGNHAVPQWASVVGLIVAAALAVMVWRESRPR